MKKRKTIVSDPLDVNFNQTSSGRRRPLLPSHKIVYRALRAANLVYERVVSINEIMSLLTSTEKAELNALNPSPLDDRVRKIMPLLIKRGIVFAAGKSGLALYFGATEIIDSETAKMPERRSRRERVLEIIQEATDETKRALRSGEIWDYAKRSGRFSDFDQKMLVHDVLSLLDTGELKRIRTVRGGGKGFNLYLLSELDETLYLPTEPQTWLEQVGEAFNLVWETHLKEAEIENRKPFAVSTGEVRAEWRKMPDADPKAFEPQPVVNAMATLMLSTQQESARIRKIKRHGERALLWCPIEYTDEMIDSAVNYLSDAERIEVAVKRAVKNIGGPVTLADVKDEIDLDPSLHPAGKSEIRHVLADTSKPSVQAGGQERRSRVVQRVYHVGMLENEAYYFHGTSKLSEAYSYVESLALHANWNKNEVETRLEQLKTSSLSRIAIGNARLLIVECTEFEEKVKSLLLKKLDAGSREKMTELSKIISDSKHKALNILSSISQSEWTDLPHNVNTDVPGITSDELKKIFMPLHHLININLNSKRVVVWFWDLIRRIPNPNFKNRFVVESQEAAEFLFDRADALIFAGVKWGGLECAFQARTAKSELGRLRDHRFVIPELSNPDQRKRIIAVCCLAFLSGENGNEELLKLVKQDKEAGVRQSALWAYCFRNESSAVGVVNDVLQNDSNALVRQFASKCLTLNNRGWWGL